jgi:hypothetical protein
MCIESNSDIEETAKGFPFDKGVGLTSWLILLTNTTFLDKDYQQLCVP